MYRIVEKENNEIGKVYIDNDSIVPDIYKKMYAEIGISEVFPKYEKYDENKLELISFSLFEGKKRIAFDEVNEYSIVMAKLLIAKGYDVYFKDRLIYKFIPESKFLHIVDGFDMLDKKVTCFITDVKDMFMTDNNDTVNYILAFHNMFFLQDFINRNLKDIKYIKIKISSINGIGIIPIYLKKLNNAFSAYNIKVILDPSTTRYSVNFLNKVFCYDFSPKDETKDNTIYLDNIARIMLTYFYIKSDEKYSYEIFNKEFLNECETYFRNELNNKKTLGLLIRGTDYISTDALGEKRMGTVDVLLPIIDKWMSEYKFESIFLATEDQDVLSKMQGIYGDKLHFVNQKRFSASEFKKGQTISDREKEKYSKEEYQKNVDDTTIKYLEALYVLSKCDSFICSGMCNGYQVVKSLNQNKFMNEYLYRGK